MPEISSNEVADGLVNVFQQYYQIASNSISSRATLIKDRSLRDSIEGLAVNTPQNVALYICKLIMVLSDHRKHARLLAEENYIPLVGKFTEQAHLPVKLLTKFVQLQQRLVNAQKDAQEKPEPKRRTKELVFILPNLTQLQQHAVSQATLQNIKGMVSVSFRVNQKENNMHCVIRCLLHIEPKDIATNIMRTGFDEVGYLHINEQGDAEVFKFYRDEDQSNVPDDLPQYLDENIEVFDPTCAVAAKGPQNWLSSAKSIFSFW